MQYRSSIMFANTQYSDPNIFYLTIYKIMDKITCKKPANKLPATNQRKPFNTRKHHEYGLRRASETLTGVSLIWLAIAITILSIEITSRPIIVQNLNKYINLQVALTFFKLCFLVI